MEKQIVDAMNDYVVTEAAKHYSVPFEDIKRLGGFENFIYEYKKDGSDFILRFVHSSHRTFEYVAAELEFIDYLAKSGANVSTVVKTDTKELIIKVATKEDEYFTVCVFTKASGTYIKREQLTDEFLYMFGKAVGRLHALTKDYKPERKRYHWHEEDYIELGRKYLPDEYKYVIDKAIEHQELIKEFETDKDSYGLIHTDLHFGNMYYDGNILTFFDFDDSSYKHFISDIAIIIFYMFGISELTDEEIETKTISVLKSFIKGYKEHNHLDKKWYNKLNDFLQLRVLILFMVVYAAGEETINSRFGKIIVNKYKDRIKNDTPFFDLERVLKELELN